MPIPEPMRLTDRLTMAAALERRAADTPEHPFLWCTETGLCLTYRAFNEAANRLAHGLADYGVRRGDLVVFVMANRPSYLIASYALKKIGAVEAGLNGSYDASKLTEQLETLQPKWAFLDSGALPKLAPLLLALSGLCGIVLADSASDIPIAEGGPEITPWDALQSANACNPTVPGRGDMDVAMILMSSGTTGVSKAIQLTHRMAFIYADGLTKAYGLDAGDRVYVPWPLFHATGAICDTLTALYAGAGVILAPKFSARAFWDHIRRFGGTWASSLGILQKVLWNAAPQSDDRDHPLRLIWGGPHPIPRAVFRARFGVEASLGYGTSEIGLINFQQPDDPETSYGRVRRDVYDIRIVDETGDPVPNGTKGEIVCRAVLEGAITPGYLGRPELDARTVRDGWFHTGDIGWLDESDQLYYLERRDSMIRHKGMLIAPADVEAMLERHPDVATAAVIRVPSDWGDYDIAAFVEPVQGRTPTPEEIRAFCAAQGPKWMVPARIRVLDRLPLTETGKLAISALERLV